MPLGRQFTPSGDRRTANRPTPNFLQQEGCVKTTPVVGRFGLLVYLNWGVGHRFGSGASVLARSYRARRTPLRRDVPPGRMVPSRTRSRTLEADATPEDGEPPRQKRTGALRWLLARPGIDLSPLR